MTPLAEAKAAILNAHALYVQTGRSIEPETKMILNALLTAVDQLVQAVEQQQKGTP